MPGVQPRALQPCAVHAASLKTQSTQPQGSPESSSQRLGGGPTSATPIDASGTTHGPVVLSREPSPESFPPSIVRRKAVAVGPSDLRLPAPVLAYGGSGAGSPTRILHLSTQLRSVAGRPDFGPGLSGVAPRRSSFTHRSWRSQEQVAGQAGFDHKFPSLVANTERVQRFALPSTSNAVGGMEGQLPTLPALPDSATSIAQKMPNTDINQLAHRVYDLLVQRLVSERRRRGM